MSATILQEVEEAFAQTKDKLAGMQHIMRTDSVLKNEIELYSIDEYALEKAMNHGVDPQLRSDMAKSSVVSTVSSSSGTSTQPTGSADPVLEEQLSILKNYLLARDLSLTFGVDVEEEEYSARDVLLSMKLPKGVFESLLKPVRNSRPALYKTLLSQSLISGESKLSTLSKKKRRGMIMDLKNKQKKGKNRSNSLGERPGGENEKEGTDKQRSRLASVVGKGVAEETMTSYLTVVCLLLNVMKEERQAGSSSSGSGGGKKAAAGAGGEDDHLPLTSVPVANVIGALFEKRGNLTSDSGAREAVPNPFGKFLLSTLDAANGVRKAKDTEAVSPGDSEEEEEDDEEELEEAVDEQAQAQSETAIAAEGDAHSDHASRAGSSRDGASVDEVGAPRSARTTMTIRSDIGTVSLSGMSETGSIALPGTIANSETTSHAGTIDYGDHDAEIDEEMMLAAGEAGRPRLGGGGSSSGGQGESHGGGSREGSSPVSQATVGHQQERIGTPVHEMLPDVPPLATYGPFCSAAMHRVIEQEGMTLDSSQPHIPATPLEDVIVALLTVLAASADHKLGVPSAPCSPNACKGGEGEGNITVLKDPLTSYLAMTPNAVNLMLVDYTLDILFDELSDLSKGIAKMGDREGANVKEGGSNAPTRVEAVGEKEESSRLSAFSEPSSRMYFLTWCIGAVLKTLCASFKVASETGLPANTLGLGVVADINKADEASTPSQSSIVKDKDKEGLDQAVNAGGDGAKSDKEGAALGAAGGGGTLLGW